MPERVASLLPALRMGSTVQRVDAVRNLTAFPEMEAWREICRSYDAQPTAVKSVILDRLGSFGHEYGKAIEGLPEFGLDLEDRSRFKKEIDDLMRQIEDDPTPAQIEKLRDALDRLQARSTEGAEPERAKRIATDLANLALDTLQKALASRDPRLADQGRRSLWRLAGSLYVPFETPLKLCGVGTNESYQFVLRDLVTTAARKEVQARPGDALTALEARWDGYRAAALALADMRISKAKPAILALLGGEGEDASVGFECLVTWPFEEGLPALIQSLDHDGDSFDGDAMRCALTKYGAEGVRAVLRGWGGLSASGRANVLGIEADVPSRATLELIEKGSLDDDADVRLAAVNALEGLFRESEDDAPASDLTDADRDKAHRLLVRLASDKDREVAGAALDQLDAAGPPPF